MRCLPSSPSSAADNCPGTIIDEYARYDSSDPAVKAVERIINIYNPNLGFEEYRVLYEYPVEEENLQLQRISSFK